MMLDLRKLKLPTAMVQPKSVTVRIISQISLVRLLARTSRKKNDAPRVSKPEAEK